LFDKIKDKVRNSTIMVDDEDEIEEPFIIEPEETTIIEDTAE